MLSNVYTSFTSLVILFAIFILSACGPSVATLKSLESDISRERSQIRALQSAKQSVGAYHKHLKTGDGSAVMIGKVTLQKAIKSMLPYTYKGRELDKKYLAGEISFTRVEGLTFEPGNRARFWLHFDGRKIKTKKVPSFAKGQVRSLKQAVKAGRMLIEVSGYIHQKKRALVVKSTPIKVQFKRQNTSSNQSRFLDAARRKIFRKRKYIPLPSSLKGRVEVLTTPHNLVFIRK